MYKKMKDLFKSYFDYDCDDIYFAPSRINLIGEHIDYNGGKVFPCAISIGTYGAVKLRDDNYVNLYSQNMNTARKFTIDDCIKRDEFWTDYVKGMINEFIKSGYKVGGFDMFIYGNIPNGAGLSSSASIEMLLGIVINDKFNDNKVSNKQLALMGKNTENEFMGLKSGIMDQLAIIMGKENKATLLDTVNLDCIYKVVKFDDAELVIMNTNKRRSLVGSEYNKRVNECNKVLDIIKTHININNLCEVDIKQKDNLINLLNDDVLIKRFKHIVTENDRVAKFISACEEKNASLAGEILNDSHYSLSKYYEVSCEELDSIVECANNSGYCFGARMTGAGFGGCAIALIKKNSFEKFKEYVNECYKERVGYYPELIPTEIGSTPRKL